MKKIYIIFILLSFIRINALENITIDNNSLIPNFDKNIYVYNYFTNKDEVNIVVNKKDNENVIGDGIITLNYKDQESQEIKIIYHYFLTS